MDINEFDSQKIQFGFKDIIIENVKCVVAI